MNTEIKANKNVTLTIFSIIFFGWGLLTSLNGVLIGHMNEIFALDSFQSGLISFTFFATYFVVSLAFFILSSKNDILNQIGYKYLTVSGLSIAAIGAYLFYPASAMLSFPFFMFALVILASGITVLQISANTYITNLGEASQGASRLNMAQALNSLGATLGPAAGAILIVKMLDISEAEAGILSNVEILSLKQIQATALQLPYWIIATSLFILAALIFILPMPDIVNKPKSNGENLDTGTKLNLTFATIGIFVYVGAEVTIGANLGNIIDKYHPELIDEKAFLITSYWGLAMIGRFVGSMLLKYINSGYMIMAFGAGAVGLLVSGITATGSWSIYMLVGIGAMNSIMFPGIFASGVHKLKGYTGKGASLLIMAIAGGAIIPAIYTFLIPITGMKGGLLIAAICYAYIAFYGKYHAKFSLKE